MTAPESDREALGSAARTPSASPPTLRRPETCGRDARAPGKRAAGADDSRIEPRVSGGAGRHPPIGNRRLELAVGVFPRYGYEARYPGRDGAAREAKRYREESQ